MDDFFSAVVSNPPYHIATGDGTEFRHGHLDIFPMFQEVAFIISDTSSMVYPATWQRDITQGLGALLIKNNLSSSTTFDGETVFEGVNISVSVVHLVDHEVEFINVNGVQRQRAGMVKWFENEDERLLYESVKGLPKLLPPTSPSNWANTVTAPGTFYESAECLVNPVKIFIKRAPGHQADSAWFFMERAEFEELLPAYENLDKYKVVIRSRLFGRQALFNEVVFQRNGGNGLQTEVFGPGEFFGQTRWEWKAFDTLEEAENFQKYVNTMRSARLAALDFGKFTFGSFIPDLGEWTNKGD